MGADPRPPAIHVVHDDESVRRRLGRDLAPRFGADYAIAIHERGEDAIAALRGDAAEGRRVAVVLGGVGSAPGGAQLLAVTHDLHPHARRVLLVPRGAWREEHPAVAALRSGRADAYVFVPWGPRERWLYLPVTEVLADWEASQKPTFEAVQVVGEEWEPRTHELRDVLSRAGLPVGFYEAGSAEARELLRERGVDATALPVLVFPRGGAAVDPSIERIATALGFATEPDNDRCDLVIVGAGPAGLAAAVYAASEGLSTAVVECAVPGGQAGTSARIRNYLGFPNGISGRDLASRALEQAWFFGARIVLSRAVTGLRADGADRIVRLAGGHELAARTVVVATGVTWHRLGVPSLEALQGAGVFYGAPTADSVAVEGASVFVVGGGNSAGQAAVHLARSAASVTLVVRGDRLDATMSEYLVSEVDTTPNVRVRLRTEVIGGGGDARLTSLVLRDNATGASEEVGADALHVLIGTRPETRWLDGVVARDERGYVLTGRDLASQREHAWPLERPPLLLETSLPGVFAAGDVRHGSVKRVASAVGAGSIAVQLVHLRLAELAADAAR
jgi:thioredoxin reductase (NADPH)